MKKLLIFLIIAALLVTFVMSPAAKTYISDVITKTGLLIKLGLQKKPEAKKCAFCDKGYIPCTQCGGDGEAAFAVCGACNKECNIYSVSKKTGLTKYYCNKCKKWRTEYVVCQACDGKGHKKCDKCKGLGVVLE